MNGQNGLDLYEVLRASHLFKRLNDEQVTELANQMPVETIRKGSLVFDQGGAATNLYIVLSGRVDALAVDKGKNSETRIGFYQPADILGQDALHAHAFYQMRARAADDVTLAVFSHDQYRRLVKNFPAVESSFEMIYHSYHLALQLDLSWCGEDEAVHFVARKHPFFLFLRLLIPIAILVGAAAAWVLFFSGAHSTFSLILAGLVSAVGMFLFFWIWLDWSNDYVFITNRRVIYQERVVLMYESQQEAPLEAILSDDIVTTYWGRVLGFGNVLVRTFTGSMVLPRLAEPREVKMILAERRTRAAMTGRVSRREMMQGVLQRRLGGEPNASIPQENKPIPPQVKTGSLGAALNALLEMRWEKGDAIIYRTHWLILFKNIAIPSGVGLFVFALLIWGVIRQNFLVTPLFLALLLLVLLADLVFWIYQYVDWANDQYIITPMELVDVYKKPLGKEERRSAPLESIQSINHERKNFIALIFNYGTVFIRVGEDTLSFDNVPNPAVVQREIFNRFWERKQAKEKRAAAEEQERMVEWLEAYDDVHRRIP